VFDWLVICMIATALALPSGREPGSQSFENWWAWATLGLLACVVLAWAGAVAFGVLARRSRARGRAMTSALVRTLGVLRLAACGWFVFAVYDGWLDGPVRTMQDALASVGAAWGALCLGVVAALALHAAQPVYWIARRGGEGAGFAALARGTASLVWADARVRIVFPLFVALMLSLWSLGAMLLSSADAPGAVLIAGDVIAAAALVWLSPWALLRVWRTTPLPGGAPRAVVNEVCARTRVRFSTARLWHAPGGGVNALVVGFLPGARALLVSSGSLRLLSREQFAAVVAHEAAHLERRHALWLAVAVGGAMLVGWRIGALLGPSPLGVSWALVVAGVAAIVQFGFVSRAFEREADATAARTLSALAPEDANESDAASGSRSDGEAAPIRTQSITQDGAAPMMALLERIAGLSGIGLGRFGFRHGTLGSRIASVQRSVGHPLAAAPPIRSARRWKALGVGLLLVGLFWTALGAALSDDDPGASPIGPRLYEANT
jgi:Zn-dependent protease with chaperone function